MTARRARPADAAVLAALLTDFNAEFDTPTPPVGVLERRFATLLARDDVLALLAGSIEPLGFAFTTLRPSPYYEGPVATLDELYVVPAMRGQGLGTRMMRLFLDWVRERGGGEVQINVDEDDRDTRRFYEAHGFSNHQPDSDERMLCYVREL